VANLKRMVAKLDKDLNSLANGASTAKANSNKTKSSPKTAATGASGKGAEGGKKQKASTKTDDFFSPKKKS